MDSLLQFPHQAKIRFFRRQTFHCWKSFRSLQVQAHTLLQLQPLLWFTLHASTSTHSSLPRSSQAEQPAVELVWSKVCWLRAFACASPAPSASLAPGFHPRSSALGSLLSPSERVGPPLSPLSLYTSSHSVSTTVHYKDWYLFALFDSPTGLQPPRKQLTISLLFILAFPVLTQCRGLGRSSINTDSNGKKIWGLREYYMESGSANMC